MGPLRAHTHGPPLPGAREVGTAFRSFDNLGERCDCPLPLALWCKGQGDTRGLETTMARADQRREPGPSGLTWGQRAMRKGRAATGGDLIPWSKQATHWSQHVGRGGQGRESLAGGSCCG